MVSLLAKEAELTTFVAKGALTAEELLDAYTCFAQPGALAVRAVGSRPTPPSPRSQSTPYAAWPRPWRSSPRGGDRRRRSAVGVRPTGRLWPRTHVDDLPLV